MVKYCFYFFSMAYALRLPSASSDDGDCDASLKSDLCEQNEVDDCAICYEAVAPGEESVRGPRMGY